MVFLKWKWQKNILPPFSVLSENTILLSPFATAICSFAINSQVAVTKVSIENAPVTVEQLNQTLSLCCCSINNICTTSVT